jgi:hypothetical protein
VVIAAQAPVLQMPSGAEGSRQLIAQICGTFNVFHGTSL